MNAAKTNHISLSFDAISENEAFARMTAAMDNCVCHRL